MIGAEAGEFHNTQRTKKKEDVVAFFISFTGGGSGNTYEVEPGEVVDAEVLEATEVSPVERLAGLQIEDPPACKSAAQASAAKSSYDEKERGKRIMGKGETGKGGSGHPRRRRRSCCA